ncbi:MAG: heavy-metal-associated domain-containing protein [Flavobacteriaceae bacterium]|tara:strand:- start:119 stop:472 length:354 start_codon:yes stop_codon:yes gene_type:complete
MKKILLLSLFIISMSVVGQSQKNKKSNFEVIGNCEICKKRIEKTALSLKGVKMATWDIPSNILSVTYNSNKVLLDQIQSAIANVGHDTPLFKAPDNAYNELPMCCIYERNKIKKTLE